MKIAQQFFQLVGGSASECGTSETCLSSMSHHWSRSYADWPSLTLSRGTSVRFPAAKWEVRHSKEDWN